MMRDAERTSQRHQVRTVTRKYDTTMTPAARFDFALVAALSISSFVVAMMFDLSERVVGWSRVFEQWEFDEIVLCLFVLSVSSSWFAFRRLRELRKDIAEGEQVAPALKRSREELEKRVESRTAELEDANQQLQAEITERKLAAAALQESATHQQRLVEEQRILAEIGRIISASPDIPDVYASFAAAVQKLLPFDRIAISLVDLDTKLIANNYVSGIDILTRRATDIIPITGTMTEATLGAPQGLLFHPQHETEVAQQFPGLMPFYRHGLQSFLAIPLISRDTALGVLQMQTYLPNRYTEQMLRLAASVGTQIAGAIATAQLYHERQRVEQALRDSEERFRGLVENSPSAVVLKDRDGCFRLVNKRFMVWYGTTENDVIGKTSFDIYPQEYAARDVAQDRAVLSTGTMVEQELDVPFADGTLRSILVTKYPVVSAGGDPIGVGTINTDMTDRKRAEAQLARHNQALEQAVQETTREMETLMARMVRQEKLAAIGQVSGSIAHELRNPLGAVKQSVFFLNRLYQTQRLNPDNPKVLDHLRLMDGEIDAADRIITQLLAVARNQPQQLGWLELQDLIDKVLEDEQWGERLILDLSCHPEPFVFWADRWRMQHVFVNLLRNAADACDHEGTVSISAYVDEATQHYQITVKDTGCGIPQDALAQVFEPLYTRKIWGTGLGLSLCQQLMEQQGGTITLESQEGGGTTVRLRLARPPAPAHTGPHLPAPDQ